MKISAFLVVLALMFGCSPKPTADPAGSMVQNSPAALCFTSPNIHGTIGMVDKTGALVTTGAFLQDSPPNRVLKFQQWGPSTAVVDSWTDHTVANGHIQTTILFHGTGNITGHGNDDTYTQGTFFTDIFIAGPNSCAYKNATMNLNYTD